VRRPIFRASLVAALAAASVAPGTATGGPAPAGVDPLPIAKACNAFAGDLYRALKAEPGNLVFSPYSISVALAMTREGARGESAVEMDRVLHLPQGGPGEGYRALASAIRPRKLGADLTYRLNVANALWGQQGYAFRPEYPARLRDAYGALFTAVDFRRPDAARATINDWVDKATQGRIRDVLPPGRPTTDTRLVLTNAVYFKARWAHVFWESDTKEGPFTKQDGAEVRVRLMHQKEHFKYGETEKAQVLEMPYAGYDASMVVVLPKARDGLPAVEESEGLDAWTGALKGGREVIVTFPRFRFESPHDLTKTLQVLGMRRAFDVAQADLTGITAKEPLFVDSVHHKAFVLVDEEGTEAAAATESLGGSADAPPPAEPVRFTADHPFLFLIRHRETGTVLFLGRVGDPSASG